MESMLGHNSRRRSKQTQALYLAHFLLHLPAENQKKTLQAPYIWTTTDGGYNPSYPFIFGHFKGLQLHLQLVAFPTVY